MFQSETGRSVSIVSGIASTSTSPPRRPDGGSCTGVRSDHPSSDRRTRTARGSSPRVAAPGGRSTISPVVRGIRAGSLRLVIPGAIAVPGRSYAHTRVVSASAGRTVAWVCAGSFGRIHTSAVLWSPPSSITVGVPLPRHTTYMARPFGQLHCSREVAGRAGNPCGRCLAVKRRRGRERRDHGGPDHHRDDPKQPARHPCIPPANGLV